MNDLRKAAEMALEALDCEPESFVSWTDRLREAREALRQALAQPEQEPFIYVREDNERPFGGYEHCSEADAGAFPVYTAPPKREWVGLTDDEVFEFADTNLYEGGKNYEILSFGKAIEAKLKEKNT